MVSLASLHLCLVLVLALVATVRGKVWKGNARLSSKKSWMPLTNFAFDIGLGEVSDSTYRVSCS